MSVGNTVAKTVDNNFIKNVNSSCVKVVDSSDVSVSNNECYSPLGMSLRKRTINKKNNIVNSYTNIDPSCKGGVVKDGVCLLKSCLSYNNINCIATNAACCPYLINISGSMCTNSSVPCLM
jgi:hypothetical protein